MRKLFATPEAEQPEKENKEDKSEQITTAFVAMHTAKVESLKKLITIPAENECTLLWTLNSFNAFTFIPFCISHYSFIHELHVSTYTINRRIADALVREVDSGRILKVSIYISDTIKFRMAHVVDHLNSIIATRPQITIHYGWNHSKIACIRCGTNYLVLEGSGNWGENAQHEQYLLFNNKNIYEFRKKNISMVE
jgi:hypothetical protein